MSAMVMLCIERKAAKSASEGAVMSWIAYVTRLRYTFRFSDSEYSFVACTSITGYSVDRKG
jgi:hypothetical protein